MVLALSALAAPPSEARVAKANDEFAQVLENTPEKEVVVVAFFANDISLQDIRMALAYSPLSVKGFRHGTPFYGGGYSLKQGETLDEAIANYRRDHLAFLQMRIELEDRMLATVPEDDLRKAITSHRKEADQMKEDFDKNGIRVVGVEVAGRARDIHAFRERNSFVRVIELKQNGKPQPAILP